MVYQWAFSTPPGYRDEPWVQTFSYTVQIPGFGIVRDIIIPFDRDAPGDPIEGGAGVYLTGFEVSDVAGGGQALRSVGYQLWDAFGHAKSGGYVGHWLWGAPLGNGTGFAGGYAPVFEPPLFCPFGSSIKMNLRNFYNVAVTVRCWEFRGWKRLKLAECAA